MSEGRGERGTDVMYRRRITFKKSIKPIASYQKVASCSVKHWEIMQLLPLRAMELEQPLIKTLLGNWQWHIS